MKRICLFLFVCGCAAPQKPQIKSDPMKVPTRVEDIRETLFGVQVADPYRWLEDEKAPQVKEWMTAQDKVARDYLHALPGREQLAERLKQLFYIDAISAPTRRGNHYFYTRRHANREKAVVYYRQGRDGAEKVLLDPNEMSKDKNISLGVWVPSWDGRKVAYSIHANNSDEATLYVRSLASGATGEDSKIDVIAGGKYASPSWTPDGGGFYYTRWPTDAKIPAAEQGAHADVRFHKLGTDPAQDPLLHPATGDPKQFLGVSCSRDGRWLFVTISHGWNSNDVYYRDLKNKDMRWQPLVVGVDAQYEPYAWQERIYIRTNENAPRFKLMVADPKNLERRHWKEIVPEAPDAVLDGWNLVGGHLALTWLKNAASEIEIRTLDGKLLRKVALPAIGSSSGLGGLPEDDEAYFDFTSFTEPGLIFRTSVKTGSVEKWAEVKMPIDASPYVVDQVWFPSKDGTRISMFVVHRKDMPKNGSTPFILSGYGGFNVNMTPQFYANRFPWLEAGGGFAVPNLRGGGEYGEAWHRDGMLDKKQNVFDDFIAAAEYLVKEGYTQPSRLAITGGSNGGLLMGAMTTQRPDLFAAVLCQVPLLDMLRYHKFGLGTAWIPEYGSADDEKGFKTLLAYSPYHHVKPGTKYPPLLMLSADSDDRVDPMHARKMTAALQAASDSLILLRIEPHAGHGGADLIKQAVEQLADSYAFAMKQVGLVPHAAVQNK
jgi:prolyl oligopeptidase